MRGANRAVCHSEPATEAAVVGSDLSADTGNPSLAPSVREAMGTSHSSATAAQTAPITALPAAIHSGGVMRKLRCGMPWVRA